jgi:hypothetical protein
MFGRNLRETKSAQPLKLLQQRIEIILSEMSTKKLSGGKGRPAHKADNLTAICEPIV